MTYRVVYADQAVEDLARLHEYRLTLAETAQALEAATKDIGHLREAIGLQLSRWPYSCRKAGRSPTRRELVVPTGASGYVVLFEIASDELVVVLAVRHQREEDYH